MPRIEGNIVLTVDTSGYIVNTAFRSSLNKEQIDKMNYYFEHVANLAGYENNRVKVIKNINIGLSMFIDTIKNDSFNINYLVYNADSVSVKDLSKYIDDNNAVQVEAKFPGGSDAWRKYWKGI